MMLFHYLKYSLFHVMGLLMTCTFLAGGVWLSWGLACSLIIYIVGDMLSGDDTSTPEYRHPLSLDLQLWSALPLMSVMVFAFVWSVSSSDIGGFGMQMSQWTGYDLLQAREDTAALHHISGVLLAGLMIGTIGTIVGHELTHRTWDPISMFIGRWLLAFSFDAAFAIEHVYGHHRYVSTDQDPATAPRGRNVYVHMLISTIGGNISAWNIEQSRLQRTGRRVMSVHNKVLRGYMMSLLLVGLAWGIGGMTGMLAFIVAGILAKLLLEIVNYMEHYGIVRDPQTPVQPRHSWNTNKRISSWAMFNLTRHSHHHAQGEVPFYKLQPFSDAPMMIGGYLTTIAVTLIPPLWHKLMIPKLLAWDAHYATDAERQMAAEANARSGLAGLMEGNLKQK